MKRSTAIELLSMVIRRHNTGHYSYNEKKHAEEVLAFMEELNLVKPTHKKTKVLRDIENMPYEDEVTVAGWENE
jgi:hypothetical protein